jgi:hypothetical protein
MLLIQLSLLAPEVVALSAQPAQAATAAEVAVAARG